MNPTTIAIDLAKDVFQIAISDGHGQVRARRRLTRRQFAAFVETLDAATTVVMETCGTAHYWGRRCARRGATVRLLPAQYVRPYVRRDKTDRADTEALLEAHRCGGIHAVPVKTVEQQMIQGLHRVRQQWQTTRVSRINLLRGLLREHGLAFPTGRTGYHRLTAVIADPDTPVPALLRTTLAGGPRRAPTRHRPRPRARSPARAAGAHDAGDTALAADPRRRRDHRDGARGIRAAYSRLSPWPALCELARTHATRIVERIEANDRTDVETRRHLFTHVTGARSALGLARRTAARHASDARHQRAAAVGRDGGHTPRPQSRRRRLRE